MARLQRGRPCIVVQHQGGPEAGSPDPHLHAEVEQPGIPVPHAELAQQSGDHLPRAGAPRHGQGLVFDVRAETPRVNFDGCLWIKEN